MSHAKACLIMPNPQSAGLTRQVQGMDHSGELLELQVVEERPLTIWLNGQEIVTAMTIGDYPEFLAQGFLSNQGMLAHDEVVQSIEFDKELEVVVVRTDRPTNYEAKLKKKTRTSGCAIGTVFGDIMEGINDYFKELSTESHSINQMPSLYLSAGAIHGTVLCHDDQPLVYMEDVGRHNAVDKVAGWMRATQTVGSDKILYTTGRLTSEMVIKCALMGIPALVSRSGFTAWGAELAQQVGLTLIGRMRGHRFQCLSGKERLIFDAEVTLPNEGTKHQRKSAQ